MDDFLGKLCVTLHCEEEFRVDAVGRQYSASGGKWNVSDVPYLRHLLVNHHQT